MRDSENVFAENDYETLRAELGKLRQMISDQRSEVKRRLDSDWRLVSFALAIIVLLAVGSLGGMYLGVNHITPFNTGAQSGSQLKQQPETQQTQFVGRNPSDLDLQFQRILSAFIPGMMLVLTVFIGFVGLKRLELYDTEIREARKEHETRQQRFEDSVADTIKAQAAAAVKRLTDEQEKKISEAGKRIEEHEQKVEMIISEYAWLKNTSEEQREALRHHSASSAGQAHKQITTLMENDDMAAAVAVAGRAIEDESVGGTPVDWFNISAQLGRNDQERLALRACQRGLQEHPRDNDLLSQALQFATKLGKREEADKYYRSLLDVGMDVWGWRGFVFVSDYLVANGNTEEAINISEEFSKRIPTDERAYSQIAQVYIKIGRTDKVVEICQRGMNAVERRAQIGILLADALIELGRYDDALNACDEAIAATAELQPSTDLSNVMWTRAAIFDAKAIILLRDYRREKLDEAVELARLAVVNYRAASSIRGIVMAYGAQTNNRIRVLLARLNEAGATREQLAYVLGSDEAGES
jgi:tetratricopeptide (TPR) repeat protein